MRMSSFKDCLCVLEHYEIDPSAGAAIDVGGTETLHLSEHGVCSIACNPVLKVKPDITFLDGGYNVDQLNTPVHERADFLDFEAIKHMKDKFDLTFCFDTLEHVSNPFGFCDHLALITKPGGYIYVSTLFNFVYHPSPGDYFRFTPAGLQQCFTDTVNRFRDRTTVVWSGWESDGLGVAILVHKGLNKSFDPNFSLPRPAPSPYAMIHIKNPVLCKIIKAVRQVRRVLIGKKSPAQTFKNLGNSGESQSNLGDKDIERMR